MKEPTVWIIDDDMVSQFATNYRIEQSSKNCRIIGHYTAHEGLTFLRKVLDRNDELPDVLLLDLVMPGMDGWSFLREIEKIGGPTKKTEVYILSAFTNSEDRRTAKDHPLVKGFFDKPLSRANVERIFHRSAG